MRLQSSRPIPLPRPDTALLAAGTASKARRRRAVRVRQPGTASCPARLLAAARAMQCRSVRSGLGRCFFLALELARTAQRNGIEVRLVHWRIVGDPHFRDHWAVALDDTVILDPTRVQVDGRQDLLGKAVDYPRHFGVMHAYPGSLFLPDYEHWRNRLHARERLPGPFMRRVRWRMALHDLGASRPAWQRPQAALRAVTALVEFHAAQLVSRLRERLERRQAELLGALSGSEAAGPPARQLRRAGGPNGLR